MRSRWCRSNSLRITTSIALALLLVGCGSDSSDGRAENDGSHHRRAENWTAMTDDDALFTVDCTFSHRASDDPIVHYGEPGVSHSHEFFGSNSTDAWSTGKSLHGTATSCEDTDDTAAYWVPTLSVGGRVVEPAYIRAYYRARPGTDVRDVEAPPTGLAMIAGNPDALAPGSTGDGVGSTTTMAMPMSDSGDMHDHAGTDAGMDHGGGATLPAEQQLDVAGWGCGLRPRHFHASPPTNCTDPSPLTLRLLFPDCWDGRHLDTADHRSHVAQSHDGKCPPGYPVLMTEIQVSIVWPVTGPEAATITLASGSVHGAHGDFLNGWDHAALEHHVDLCIHAKANCTIG